MHYIKVHNLFSQLPEAKNKEVFTILNKGRNFRIERIVSKGQATPKDTWCCEKTAEWVMVLRGKASLLFKGYKKEFILKAGDYVFIPPNTHHRVDWTHPNKKTLWLAVYLKIN